MVKHRPRLLLVDGSSYLFRAYHALPQLTNSKGEATGAIVGVINMLRKLMADYQPEYLAVVFDAPDKTFRHELYPEYKANRPEMPEELSSQIEPLHAIISALGVPVVIESGVEADDVIGTLATQAVQAGMDALVSTSDKDLTQLVTDRITLIDTMSNTVSDRKKVQEKFGVKPEQMIDYLALVGDASDNIPGVPKCGPKTAAKWLDEYDSLDNLVTHADQIKGKVGEYLRHSLDQLPLSRELVTIKLDLDLHEKPWQLRLDEPNTKVLRDWYQKLEAQRLLATLDEARQSKTKPVTNINSDAEIQYELVLKQVQFDKMLTELQSAELLSLDTETTSIDALQAELVGLSFAVDNQKSWYLPVAHDYPGMPEQLDRAQVLAALKPLLEDENFIKLGQHLKYDMNVLANYGIEVRGVAFDTMLESYVLDSTAVRHDMDSLAKYYLDYSTTKYEDVAGKGSRQLTFNQVPLEAAAPYSAEDALVALQLHRTLWPKLKAQKGQRNVFEKIEMPLVPVLSRIERTGVRIDTGLLKKQSKALQTRMHSLEEQAYAVAGRSFNMNSPKQIGEIFFGELGLPVIAKTPTGSPSTAEHVLQELAEQGHELPALIFEHRGLAKLVSTYTGKLPQMVNPYTGRVHTSYHQAITATGRLSSTDPNLQNIPVRTEDGRRIREAFIADTGWRIVAADYSQIELRIMAHLSGDQALLKAFEADMDIHRATAAEVFGVTLDQVDGAQRRAAKAINFGLMYGMSAFGLAKQLGVERGMAQDYIDRYFERYPGVHKFMEVTRKGARDWGFVETLFGRRLYLPEINARNSQRRAAAERTAINAPMQGTAADIIKRAMLAIDCWIQDHKPPVRMIMQVHDELVFEVAEVGVDASIAEIGKRMSAAADLRIPLLVDTGVGDNWEQAH